MERRQGLTSFAEIWAAVAAVLHGLAATAVTAHVLLKKRDVRSAIAWIGVAWLSPGLGAVLYFVFGINRVVRRAVRIRRRVARSARAHGDSPLSEAAKLPRNIAAIAGVGERATGFPLTSGNRLTSFRGGDEAYPAMLDAIGGA